MFKCGNVFSSSNFVALVYNHHSQVAIFPMKKLFLTKSDPNPQNIQMIYSITNKFCSISNSKKVKKFIAER